MSTGNIFRFLRKQRDINLFESFFPRHQTVKTKQKQQHDDEQHITNYVLLNIEKKGKPSDAETPKACREAALDYFTK
ncbi:CLUMA_CG007423, isoform A [Clunio marinus]|uniref:CLUMA_CG007423, isoform A n=1 Tax=Clunio marinus TaxID=568069 RepID=A0A1J1I0N5_9DIPT|nr:CLUMA_CG007423, isoform A [Clunio marinus]